MRLEGECPVVVQGILLPYNDLNKNCSINHNTTTITMMTTWLRYNNKTGCRCIAPGEIRYFRLR